MQFYRPPEQICVWGKGRVSHGCGHGMLCMLWQAGNYSALQPLRLHCACKGTQQCVQQLHSMHGLEDRGHALCEHISYLTLFHLLHCSPSPSPLMLEERAFCLHMCCFSALPPAGHSAGRRRAPGHPCAGPRHQPGLHRRAGAGQVGGAPCQCRVDAAALDKALPSTEVQSRNECADVAGHCAWATLPLCLLRLCGSTAHAAHAVHAICGAQGNW